MWSGSFTYGGFLFKQASKLISVLLIEYRNGILLIQIYTFPLSDWAVKGSVALQARYFWGFWVVLLFCLRHVEGLQQKLRFFLFLQSFQIS